jgi:hypothetical chaperone protein
MRQGVGIDFGTTNSAVAVARGTEVQIARFGGTENSADTFRSVLYFDQKGRRRPLAGRAAIEQYLGDEDRGRLIQSVKSFLGSRVFSHTSIGHRRYTLENLIAFIIRACRAECEGQLGSLGTRVVVGRPVRFVGAESKADEAFALARLQKAFTDAGFREIEFEFEPVGAAYHYESTLDHDETILIADFGGGTSDFSILRVGPGVRRKGRESRDLLATAGVPLAGDVFDAKIIRNLISPLLGLGTFYCSMDKTLPVPTSMFMKLERWHHLSFLKTGETMQTLRSIRAQALEPEKIEKLIDLVEDDLGFYLHRSVQRAKFELSSREQTMFEFDHAGLHIRHPVNRMDFEGWIAGELEQIRKAVEEALYHAALSSGQIDRVFLTGGSSLVPAVRRIFDQRFTPERVSAGDEFTSVARGLALRAAEA